MMRKKVYNIALVLLLSASSLAANTEDNVDHISLASLMIYDDKFKKAQEELDAVNKKAPTFDAAKFYTVSGVLASKQNLHKQAVTMFTQAIEATKVKTFKEPKSYTQKKYLFEISSDTGEQKKKSFDPQKIRKENISDLYMHLAKEYYQLKDYKNTIKSLDNAGEKGSNKPSLYTLRADCHWKLSEHDKAVESLNKGFKKFPKEYKLLKQKFYYFAELKLYQAAIDTAKEYMDKIGVSAKEYVATAQMLIGANEIDQAIRFLEEAKMKFPKNSEITILLGHMYLKKDYKHASAHLFDQSAYNDKKYLNDAVEINKRAGNTTHALYLNAQNPNKQAKLKQKIAIYLNSEEYRKIIGLKRALERYNMLKDENIRYTLAYAYYMVGDYFSSEEQLKYISDNELFLKATVIRKNIEKCTNNTLECL
ncbi:tetratricopeptide repeat protein [Sulfurimonas marina]|uniref:Tetratricopeptide repeat protein n=1 Tax=Sulfurimonas marina TaxID=2590551 RepID=A0A7M1AX34_9BACT|nr:hypothetical protein [Sulfurimonas marina]QOP42000.1 hypothetical protein FJR03_09725 [Sulfurimonas marina]